MSDIRRVSIENENEHENENDLKKYFDQDDEYEDNSSLKKKKKIMSKVIPVEPIPKLDSINNDINDDIFNLDSLDKKEYILKISQSTSSLSSSKRHSSNSKRDRSKESSRKKSKSKSKKRKHKKSKNSSKKKNQNTQDHRPGTRENRVELAQDPGQNQSENEAVINQRVPSVLHTIRSLTRATQITAQMTV